MEMYVYKQYLIAFSQRCCIRRHFQALARGVLIVATVSTPASATDTTSEELLDCLIEPWVVSDVGSPVQGILDKLLVDRGETVKMGQPVAELESGVEAAAVALAAARADTQSEIQAREAELQLAKLEKARLDDLFAQKMITTQQRDESTARFRIATAALVQAREALKVQQLELLRTQRQYARRTLKSPVDGVVVSRSAFAGEFVYDNPVMTIAALDPLRVEVMLPARLFGSIHVGDQAQLYPEITGDSALISTVDVVDATLDSRSGTFGVRLVLPNPEYQIPAGQRCTIAFEPSVGAARLNEHGKGESATSTESARQ